LPENCTSPSSEDATINRRSIVAVRQWSDRENAATKRRVTTGTINDDRALRVAPGDIDNGRQGCTSPTTVAAWVNRSRPGSAVQTLGGKGTKCNAARAAAASKKRATGLTLPKLGRCPNRMYAIRTAQATLRTMTCPMTSAREAPPASHRKPNSTASRTKGRCGANRATGWPEMGIGAAIDKCTLGWNLH